MIIEKSIYDEKSIQLFKSRKEECDRYEKDDIYFIPPPEFNGDFIPDIY